MPSSDEQEVQKSTPIIVIAESDAVTRSPRADALRRAAFTVVAASNGTDALSALQTAPPDVILVCGQLHGENTDDFCRRIKGHPSLCDTLILVLSCADGIDERCPADTWMSATASPDAVVSAVRVLARLHRAEDRLRNAGRESELRLIMDASPAPMAYIDADCRYRQINDAYPRHFGLTREHVEGSHLRQILGDAAWQVLEPYVRQALDGNTVNFERFIPYANGDTRRLQVTYTPDRGHDGRIRGFVSHLAEVRAGEQETRDRTERDELVAAGALDAIWDWDVQAHRVFLSPQWKTMRGLSDREVGDGEEEWIGRIHPEDRARVLAAVERYFAGESPCFSEEYRTQCHDASWKWIVHRGIAQRGADGQVRRMAGSENDITEKKLLEAALHASEQFRQGILDSLPAHIAVLDAQGTIIAVNDPWSRFGQNAVGTADSVGVGANYLDVCRRGVLTGDFHALKALQGIEAVLNGAQSRFELEYPCNAPDHELWFVMHVMRPTSVGDSVTVTHVDITAQKRVQHALRAIQADLNQAQAIGRIGSWRLDFRRNEMEWSDQNHRIFGTVPGGPISYETFLGLVHPDDRAYVHREWPAALRANAYDFEHRIIVKGQVKWVRERAELEFDRKGALRGAFGTTQDITDRKETEREIARLNQDLQRRVMELQTVFDTAPIGLAISEDPDGRHIRGNPATALTLGLGPADEMSEAVSNASGYRALPDGRELSVDQLPMRRAAGGDSVRGEIVEVVYHTGQTAIFHCNCEPLFDEQGEPRGAVGAFLDITELKRAEAALRDSERQTRQLLEALPQLVWTCRPDGMCDYASPQWRRYTGLPESSQLGRRWLRQVHPEDRSRVLDQWREATGSGSMLSGELRLRRADGVYHWFQSRAVPLCSERGEIVKWLGTYSDIENLKRAEQVLREADRRKDEFLAMLSHELRNPLAPIRSAAAVLRTLGPDDPRLQATRDIIARQVDHMTLLIDDLLDVARINRGQIELRKGILTLRDVVDQSLEASRPLIESRCHRLTLSLPEQEVHLEGDLIRLVQVLTNLLHNAAKYTDRNGEIQLSAEIEEDGVALRITDNGIGIGADLLPRLFAVFTQGPRTLDRAQGGLGIGLSVAKRLVEMHAGTIEARSDGPGRGSEFIVRLPRLIAAQPVRQSPPAKAVRLGPPNPAAATRILIVDDNEDAAEAMGLLLTLEGHEVRKVYDGRSAIDLARSFQPQLVLLDIGLPGMDGFEVARSLRRYTELQQTVLVAVTGYAESEILRRSREAGFSRHLVKPVDTNELLEAVMLSAAGGAAPHPNA